VLSLPLQLVFPAWVDKLNRKLQEKSFIKLVPCLTNPMLSSWGYLFTEPGFVFTILHFLRNLSTDPIS
jgi:hypothetical protein